MRVLRIQVRKDEWWGGGGGGCRKDTEGERVKTVIGDSGNIERKASTPASSLALSDRNTSYGDVVYFLFRRMRAIGIWTARTVDSKRTLSSISQWACC